MERTKRETKGLMPPVQYQTVDPDKNEVRSTPIVDVAMNNLCHEVDRLRNNVAQLRSLLVKVSACAQPMPQPPRREDTGVPLADGIFQQMYELDCINHELEDAIERLGI